MMPFCDWKRCRNVADQIIDLKNDFMHPALCKKHFNKLLKILNQQVEDE